MDPARHFELALGGLGHPLLVDGQRDQRRAVRLGQRHIRIDPLAAALQVDRIDQAAARGGLERGLDHPCLG